MTDEMRAKVEKVMKNLERNKMKPYFCENREEAQALVKTLIKKGRNNFMRRFKNSRRNGNLSDN